MASASISTVGSGSPRLPGSGGTSANSRNPSTTPPINPCTASASIHSVELSVSTSATAYPSACAARCAPRSTPPKNGLVTSGMTSPTARALPVRSDRAARFGR